MHKNRGYSYRHQLGPECRGWSLPEYLACFFSHSNAAEWMIRIQQREVLIDDRFATAESLLRPGAMLVWNRPGWVEPSVPLDFQLIFQDAELLLVNKPSGLPTLPGAGFLDHTLLSLVREFCPEARPLHRLGRGTSGLVLFARTSACAATMQAQWPKVHKQYRALSQEVATCDTYDIRTPIGLVRHPLLGTIHAACPAGKASRSVATVLHRRGGVTLFQVDLHTGRPHQIRIHLASIGHPLDGDPVYVAGGIPRSNAPGLPGDTGYWLHAGRLMFQHPCTGQAMDYHAPPPSILAD